MLKKIATITISFLTFILPLFFLPITLNFFATNKEALVVIATIILLLAFAFHLWKNHHFPFKKSPLLFPLSLFSLTIILNLLFISHARTEALINRGILYLALTFITYLLTTLNFNRKTIIFFINSLIASGSLLAIWSVLQILLLHQLNQLPAWMQAQTFTPTGSVLITLTILTLTLVTSFVHALKNPSPVIKTLLLILSGIQLAAIVAYLTLIYQGSIDLFLLPYKAGWSLALDALKSPKNLLLGIGLANFPTFFTSAKPLFLNQTKFWNIIPTTSSSELLHLLTTTGLLGFVSFVSLITTILKLTQSLPQTKLNYVLKTSFITLTLLFIFVPANLTLIVFFFITAGLIANQVGQPTTIKLHRHLSHFLTTIAIVIAGILSYGLYRVYAAEYYMRQAQLALAKQDAKATYENHLKAIQLMPTLAAYHTSLSQIDLDLASAISQKQTLSDQDKQQIASLIQQAIAEAKTAVQLQPNNSGLWQNLALIYRNLITTAQNADQFAIQYYTQALKLDPANPFLHLRYGGLFYQLAQLVKDKAQQQKLLNQALQQFQTAIQLRPTYANAYYNLAKTYELMEDYPSAYQAMQQVLANLEPDSTDYNLAKEELKKLEEKLPKKEQSNPNQKTTETKPQPKELSQPSPLPSPLPTNESINLEK